MASGYGERAISNTAQPVHTFVNIWVNGELLQTNPAKPNFIQGFDLTRLEGVGEKGTLTIFDDDWDKHEELLSRYPNDVQLQYGYVNGRQSPRYNMMLQDYSISFNFTGVILNINVMTQGYAVNLNPVSVQLGTTNPTEAVMKLCEAVELQVHPENFDASETLIDTDETFEATYDNVVDYINLEILPQTLANGEVFAFWIDSTTTPPTAYFKKKTYDMITSPDEMKTYVYLKGYDSVVKDITFHTKGIFGGTTNFQIVSGFTAETYDPIYKSIGSSQEDLQTTVTETTGEYQFTDPNQANSLVDPAGYTAQQVNNQLYYRLKNATDQQYEADMTIIGDPTLKLLESVRIINVTDSGHLHHTSGIYMVKGISDSIQGGTMLTSVKLVHTADIEGRFELKNYRDLLK